MITTADAHIAGLRAAMEPADPRVVPAQFARNAPLAAAWLEAYDGISTALLNQRPDVMESSAKAERHTDKEHSGPKRPKAAAPVPEKPKAQAKPTMMAILESRVSEHA